MIRIGNDIMRKLFSVLFLVLIPAFAWAQSIKVQGQKIVSLGEQFSLSFVIDTDQSSRPSDFKWNPGDDFQVVWGPQTGTSTSTVIRGGKTTTSSQYSYSYILIARKEGKFSLAPATATMNGRQISSESFQVEVVKSSSSSSGSQAGQSQGGDKPSASQTGTISDDDLFIRLNLSRSSAVIGEPVKAELKLYQKVDIAGFEDVRFPSFTGFWSQPLESPTNIEFQREVLGDKIYNSALLRSWILVPQQAGDLTIDASEITCLVNIRVSRRNQSVFDSFFDDGYRTIRKRVYTKPVKLPVSKLPAGAPESFNGGVGSFSMKASLSRDSLAAHEAASLTITITGNGNVSLLEAPKVNFPPDFEVYDVKSSEKTTQGGTSGSKTFEYPFIPRSRGDFVLEPVQWSYYDINSRKWVTLSTREMSIPVSGDGSAPVSDGSQGLRLPERSGVRNLSEDIRFIRTSVPSLSGKTSMLVGRAVYPVLIVLMGLFTVAFLLIRRRSAIRRADVAGSRVRRATRMALKRLSAAKGYLDKNIGGAFYEELHKALLGYIADKFNMPQEELDHDNISTRLAEAGVKEEVSGEFLSLVDACEFARYAPGSGAEALQGHYDSAVRLISAIDSSMKSSSSSKAAKALSVVILFGLMVPGALASPSSRADSLWTKGVQAYSDGLWDDALVQWNAIEADGYHSPVLSYNIGNAAFKAGDMARAILNYERALKADPSFTDARNNLEYASSLIQDRIDAVPEFLLKSWARGVCYTLSSNTWAVLSLLLFALACFFAIRFALGGVSRRGNFYGGIAVVLLFAVTLSFALWQKNDSLKEDSAIVMKPVSSVKNTPTGGTASRDLFVLHEGVKVKVLDSVGQYSNIELSDGRQGWILSSDIEVI